METAYPTDATSLSHVVGLPLKMANGCRYIKANDCRSVSVTRSPCRRFETEFLALLQNSLSNTGENLLRLL